MAAKQCPNCGRKCGKTFIHCPKCGSPLDGDAQQSLNSESAITAPPSDKNETENEQQKNAAKDIDCNGGFLTMNQCLEVLKKNIEYKLVILNGSQAGQAITLKADDNAVIGANAGSDLLLSDDQYVSGSHAEVRVEGTVLVLKDSKSTNGVYVRVGKGYEIKEGDEILIGWTRLKVVREG